MIRLALFLLLAVRPELVEGRPEDNGSSRASTGSARTDGRGPIEAERAFAAAAQKDGQWTAFRRFAAPNATMFAPQPVNAIEHLTDRKDPPRSIRWSPTASWLSCDGRMAVDTGEWRAPGSGHGYFSTIWERQPGSGEWKWLVDGGDALKAARPRVASPKIERAACTGTPPSLAIAAPGEGEKMGTGASNDRTLRYTYVVATNGARTFTAGIWDGAAYRRVIDDRIAAP